LYANETPVTIARRGFPASRMCDYLIWILPAINGVGPFA
jgi:hypothetical protein